MIKPVTHFLLFSFFISFLLPVHARSIEKIDRENQKEILVYVNKYRAQKGLKPLIMNKLMSDEAAKHSRNMATKVVSFGHENFNKRIHRLFNQIPQCKSGSENVAYNYKDGKDVVRNWLTSRGHRRNIEGNYNLTGIGLARDAKGKLYFTQIFIRTAQLSQVRHA